MKFPLRLSLIIVFTSITTQYSLTRVGIGLTFQSLARRALNYNKSFGINERTKKHEQVLNFSHPKKHDLATQTYGRNNNSAQKHITPPKHWGTTGTTARNLSVVLPAWERTHCSSRATQKSL